MGNRSGRGRPRRRDDQPAAVHRRDFADVAVAKRLVRWCRPAAAAAAAAAPATKPSAFQGRESRSAADQSEVSDLVFFLIFSRTLPSPHFPTSVEHVHRTGTPEVLISPFEAGRFNDQIRLFRRVLPYLSAPIRLVRRSIGS